MTMDSIRFSETSVNFCYTPEVNTFHSYGGETMKLINNPTGLQVPCMAGIKTSILCNMTLCSLLIRQQSVWGNREDGGSMLVPICNTTLHWFPNGTTHEFCQFFEDDEESGTF
jgi:hypothetical protein